MFLLNPPDDDGKAWTSRSSSARLNGQLAVSTCPNQTDSRDEAQNHIVPLTVTGTPQELDTGFLQAVQDRYRKRAG